MSARRLVCPCAVALFLALGAPVPAWAAPTFSTPPALPTLPTVTLNAQAQTTTTAMTNFAVKTGILEGSGWHVTVVGQSGTGNSAVFAQYCPQAGGCGADAFGYVSSGQTLPANSLTLNTTGASFTGGTGPAPTLQCSSPCNIDSASAEKIASETGGGLLANSWTTTGFSATSLALHTATTLRILPSGEVYRVNVSWTLSTGP
ncbi:MAG: hypothetical protein M3Z95_07510 [Actinomycetota bacterium]|nr:hypothetical protein [Actinomycetota bacterium]